MCLFRKNIFLAFFKHLLRQTSHLEQPCRITQGQLDPSCCCCLLQVTHPAHETSQGDVAGVRLRSQERHQTSLLLRELTQTQRGAESSPELGRPCRRGNGATPQGWAGPRLPALREGGSCHSQSHRRSPTSREVKEKGKKPRETKVLETLQPKQPNLRQGKAGRGSRDRKEKKHLSKITPQEANSVFKSGSALN